MNDYDWIEQPDSMLLYILRRVTKQYPDEKVCITILQTGKVYVQLSIRGTDVTCEVCLVDFFKNISQIDQHALADGVLTALKNMVRMAKCKGAKS